MSDPQLQRSHVSRHAIKLAVTNRCMVVYNFQAMGFTVVKLKAFLVVKRLGK